MPPPTIMPASAFGPAAVTVCHCGWLIAPRITSVTAVRIESGHRHVIQQRLKLAGSWWKEPHAEAMLGLRVARANHLWDHYWSTAKPALN
jgi:hypothetical protein